MSLNEHFDGLVEPSLPVLFCPPNAPNDVVPAMVADSFHGGIINLNVFPTGSRRESTLRTGVPHISDPRLYKDGKPTPLAMYTGFWMFPKWYENILNLRVVSVPESAPSSGTVDEAGENKSTRKAKG